MKKLLHISDQNSQGNKYMLHAKEKLAKPYRV